MAEANMTSSVVPVLFTSESIVLPGMVVPIELDDAARAAVDAAQASESGELLIAPRLEWCAAPSVPTSGPAPMGPGRHSGSR